MAASEKKKKKEKEERPKEEQLQTGQTGKKKREKSVFREYFELIAETAIFVFFVMTYIVQAFQIPSGSMEPTLLVGDFLLVNKFIYARPVDSLEAAILPSRQLHRKDIIVFKYPRDLSKDFVKRVIGLEGDKIEIKNKQVYINDRPIDEPYKVHNDSQIFEKGNYYQYDDVIRDNYGPVVVPPGHLFAMGDNRDNSLDSRYWSFVPMSYLKGRPWIIYFSYQAERDAYLKNGVRDRFKKYFRFIFKTRWNRLLKVVW
jgi:signal peptidase I